MGAAAKFRRRCGAQLRQQARFCGACGGAVAAAPADPAPPADTPIRHSIAGMPMWQAAAIGAAVSLAVLAWQQGWLGKAGDTMAAATGIGDTFLSDETMQFAFARAMIRDRPTAQASTVLGALAPGDSATGRWVQGTDPSTRWLKTADGYVWDGNLAAEDSITSAGMLGLVVGMPLARMRERLDPVGMYGGQIPDWDANACEIYRSRDGRASVMVEEGKATSFMAEGRTLRTRNGIGIGTSEAQLRAVYGSRLDREGNPYDGADYFLWFKPDRGIKFHVVDGFVKAIASGGPSIRYVEGCS